MDFGIGVVLCSLVFLSFFGGLLFVSLLIVDYCLVFFFWGFYELGSISEMEIGEVWYSLYMFYFILLCVLLELVNVFIYIVVFDVVLFELSCYVVYIFLIGLVDLEVFGLVFVIKYKVWDFVLSSRVVCLGEGGLDSD